MHCSVFFIKLFLFIIYFSSVFSDCKKNPKTTHHNPNVVHGRYTRDITDFHIVVPQKVHPNGSFHSHHLRHYFNPSVRKKRDLSDERVHYLLRFGGAAHLLELEPHAGLTSPAMVVERRRRGSDLSGITLRGPRRHLCQYRGTVLGLPGSRVAVSGCDGLVGHIRTNDSVWFVEPLHGPSPVEGEEHVHVVFKRDVDTPARSCNVRGCADTWWEMWCGRLRSVLESKNPHKRSEAGVSTQRYYEAMVAADKKFLLHHKDHDVEEYIICIMNMVADYYHDASVGNMIDIVLVRIVYLEKEEEEIDLEINEDGEDTLDSFCKWQTRLNPKDPNHPNHHDVGVLFTRYDICSDDDGSGETCSLLGLAHLGTACVEGQNCCINEDGGLLLGVVTTHELGHTLSCTHDSPEESGCEPVTAVGDSTVMNPTVTPQTSAWSPCSRTFITGLFDSQMGECMLDEPQEHTYPLDDMPPGAFYDASDQCAFMFGSQYEHYEHKGTSMCEKLWCKMKESTSCQTLGAPAADGTSCGTNKWCYNQKCTEIGKRPAAVNGEWGSWGQWTTCSRTCGGGVSMRERLCNNPQPANKGRYCIGKRHEYQMCNTQDCDGGAPTFREVQCAEFNNKPFQGSLHTWTVYPAPENDPNPCALYCLSDTRVFTKLAPRVKDGTRCKPGTKHTCIQGSCLVVGCDWKINSDAVEDICGVCNGDGTHCTIVEDVFKNVPGPGYHAIAVVPTGAINVMLEEVHSSGNMIAVSAFDNYTFYLNGNNVQNRKGEYSFGGSVRGVHTIPEMDREELHIKGPLREPLVFYVVLYTQVNPGIRYSYALPSDKPMYSPKYHWEFVEWGPCSALCGGGTQIMKAACIEERDGKVKNSFCESLPKEEPRARTCNERPCRTRWKVWKWGPCSGCLFQSGTRSRQVECVRENPTATGDEEIITEPGECCGEPPVKSELCNSPRPCPKNLTSEIVKRKIPEVATIESLERAYQQSKREIEGKSFSDQPNTTAVPKFVKDPVNPESIHFEEVLLDDNKMNLTEKEFEEVGDDVPDKILSCPVQKLSGKEAMQKISESIHGEGYHKNITKISQKKNKSNPDSKHVSKSLGTESSTAEQQQLTTCKPIHPPG